LAGPLESVVRQAIQGRVDGFGARDGRLDHLGRADAAGSDGLGEGNRVVVAEGVVAEGVHAWHVRA
jgi:hypothetical protein